MATVWTWRQAIWESQLSATTKLVLQALASHLNDMGGPMFPSQERLSRLCSLSERSVITHLDLAESEGWIVARKRELNGKKWAANEYVARFPDGVKDVHPSKNGVKEVQVQGEPASCEGVKEVHTNSPYELSREHSPLTPQGGRDGSRFSEVIQEYAKANPERVDEDRAWDVWQERALEADAERVLTGMRSLASSQRWKDEGGRFVPRLSKFLDEGTWRNVPAEEDPAAAAERFERSKREADDRMKAAIDADRERWGLPKIKEPNGL